MPLLLRRLLLVTLVALAVASATYVRSETFSRRWCAFVIEQCEKHGIFLSLERLTLDPLEGLVARGIRVYLDQDRTIMLAEVNRLHLDLDYSKMLRQELFLEGADLHQADVSLPLIPEDPKSEILQIKDFSARVFLVGDRIEVRRAEGLLHGLQVSVVASVLKPRADPDETDEEARKKRKKRIAAIQARRDLIVEVARSLEHFESARKPQLELEINGDLEEPDQMSVVMRLTANGLSHGPYVCEELSAVATYGGETVDLSRLYVKDHLGELEASASWRLGQEHVNFQLRSTADLPGLAAAVFRNEAWREVVFYDPVEVVADGRYLLNQTDAEEKFLPVDCVGRLNSGRFATRGKVLEGLSLNFGLSPSGCYFRDVLLRHKSGTLGLQAMWHLEEGFRYRALLQMDPNVFLPFAKLKPTREIIQRFEFQDESSIYVEFEGHGEKPDLNVCVNTGRGELRHFKYRGVAVDHLTSDLGFQGRVQVFKNVHIQRKDDIATAKEVHCDGEKHEFTLTGVVSDVDPVALISCFDPKTADVIARYGFEQYPRVELNGLIAVRSKRTDLRVLFQAPGSARYPLGDEVHVVEKPVGDLHFSGTQLNFEVGGLLHGKPMSCSGVTSLLPTEKAYTVDFRCQSFPYQVFGHPIPFEGILADISSTEGNMNFQIKARVFDGDFSLAGSLVEEEEQQNYQGEIRIGALEFKKFAQIFSPGNETDGDVTGHMTFTGRLNDWKALRGEGALTILNGNLYAVPILGPLTPLIGSMLPRPIKGYNVAKEADCTFTVADGFVTTDNFEALTGVFRLVSKGSVDFIEDRVQFEAQAKFRGLPGLVLFPVSEILEYVGEGSVGDPLWRPRYFSSSKEKEEFRKPESMPEDSPSRGSRFRQLSPLRR